MTEEEIKQEVEAYAAHLHGEIVEEMGKLGVWVNLAPSHPWGSIYNGWKHRVKSRQAPKPNLAPWESEADVPFPCFVRFRPDTTRWRQVVGSDTDGVRISGRMARIGWDELAKNLEWAPNPNAAEWKPCAKEL